MDEMKERTKYFIFLITGIIIGGMAGIISLNLLISSRIDEYYKEIQSLQSIIEEKDLQLQKLEKVLNSKKLLIKDIKVELVFKNEEYDDEIVKITLEKHIKEKYKELLGKEISKIDVEILWEVVDNRIMKIDNMEYRLNLNKIMVTEVLRLWVDVECL